MTQQDNPGRGNVGKNDPRHPRWDRYKVRFFDLAVDFLEDVFNGTEEEEQEGTKQEEIKSDTDVSGRVD